MVERTQNVIARVSISESKEETLTLGMSYKFALLNLSIIRSLWEIGHNFDLKNPNQIIPVAFERSFRGIL